MRCRNALLIVVAFAASCDRLLAFGGRRDLVAFDGRPSLENSRSADLGPLPPPRQLWPLSGSTVTRNWPLPKVVPAGGLTVAGEMSLTPDFQQVVLSFGQGGGPEIQLPYNRPIFWRVRSTQGSQLGPYSPTWWFRIAARSSAPLTDTAWGNPADLDGDGRAEILIGAHASRSLFVCAVAAGQTNVSCDAPRKLLPPYTDDSSVLGLSVSATDVDGDGRSDLILGDQQWGFTGQGAGPYRGRAFVLPSRQPSQVQVLETGQPTGMFGVVAGLGDVNGDGWGDLAVTAPMEPVGGNFGRMYLFVGSADGIVTKPAAIIDSTVVDRLGHSVAAAGDVNGDRHADVIVGTYFAHAAFVYYGGPDGLSKDRKTDLNSAASQFGWSVAGAGDVNGDGYADIVVGAINAQVVKPHDGLAYVYLGSTKGINPLAFTALKGSPGTGEGFGHTVTGTGDMTGDGYDDVLVGTAIDAAVPTATVPRRVYLFRGGPGGVSTTSENVIRLEASFGVVAGVGDVNGDARADAVAIASVEPVASGGTGRVYPILSWNLWGPPLDAPPKAVKFGWNVGSTY